MTEKSGSNSRWTRRQALVGGGALIVGSTLAAPAIARTNLVGVRKLAFFNIHNHEKISVDYFADGRYISDGVQALDHYMRDVRDGRQMRMNRDLYDLLFDLHSKLRTNEPFHLISGYRSPGTNEWLRSLGRGVAKHSLHMRGLACDIRLPKRGTHEVWRAALGMRRGGVGLYTRSGFVHVDTGRVRHWGA